MERDIVMKFCSDPKFYAHLRTYARKVLREWPPEWGGPVNRKAEDAVNDAVLIALEDDTQFRNNPNAPTAWFEAVIRNLIKDRGRKETRTRRILAAMTAWQINEERALTPRTAPGVTNEDVEVNFDSGTAVVTGGEQMTKGGLKAKQVRFPSDPPISVHIYPMMEPPHVRLVSPLEALEATLKDNAASANRPPGTSDADWLLVKLADLPMTTREIAERTGRSQSDVSRTLRRLRQRQKKKVDSERRSQSSSIMREETT